MGTKWVDLSGVMFGDWTVLSLAERRGAGKSRRYQCRCVCGTIKLVDAGSLRKGDSTGCGCRAITKLVTRSRTHGLNAHPIKKVHDGMLARCYCDTHPYYYRYGGRGITICSEWQSLGGFALDNFEMWEPGWTIERTDNDKNYDPSNCIWIPRRQQMRNCHDTILLTWKGLTLPITTWAEDLEMSANALRLRYYAGWPTARILSEPIRK